MNLNDEILLKLALVHDLVEVYSGDVDAFDDLEQIALKEENERRAFEMIKLEFNDFQEMLEKITEYERRKSPEAQCVYVIDKLLADVLGVR